MHGSKPQKYENHTKWNPLYHFVASPISLIYFVHTVVIAVRHPATDHILNAVLALGFVATVISSRLMALTVQNRVIRFEMRVRLKEILPATLVPRIKELTVSQLVALRFASDAEMTGLVERVFADEFAKSRDIKRAVKDWQPDHLRA